jgi:hypothetical protein
MCQAPTFAFFAAVVLTAANAFGQAGLPGPLVEIGVDGTATLSPEVSGRALTPRITWKLKPELDLTLRGDATALRDHNPPYASRAQLFNLEVHQQMAHRGAVALQGIAGVGLRVQRDYRPKYGLVPDRPNTTLGQVADHVDQVRLVGLMGLGAVQRAGSALEFREDFRLSVDSGGLDIGVSTGITIPVGRYQTRAPGQSEVVGTRRVRTGQHVWVTQSDGVVVEGVIGDLTPSAMEVVRRDGRTSVEIVRVRRVEIPDSLRDGIVRGTMIGAAGLGVYGAFIASALCECDDLGTAAGLTVVSAGMGAAGGALIGALSDSLHVGRRAILDRSTGAGLSVAPLLGRNRAGAIASIRW